MTELKLFTLLCVANGAPVVASLLFRDLASCPLDNGRLFADGRPLLGESKTARGIYASLIAVVLVGLLLGIPISISLEIAFFAMLGDLFSSFIKRRLAKPSGANCPGLDQIPESLLPLLAVKQQLALDVQNIVLLVGLFIVTDLVVTKFTRRMTGK